MQYDTPYKTKGLNTETFLTFTAKLFEISTVVSQQYDLMLEMKSQLDKRQNNENGSGAAKAATGILNQSSNFDSKGITANSTMVTERSKLQYFYFLYVKNICL